MPNKGNKRGEKEKKVLSLIVAGGEEKIKKKCSSTIVVSGLYTYV